MNPTYNILFIFPLPLHPERGGVERVTDILARELAQRGHRIFYLHRPGKKGRPSYEDYEPPASIHWLPCRKLRAKENMVFYHRFLKENRIDFIINQMGVSRNYCRFTRVPQHETGFPKSISVLHSAPLMNYEHMGLTTRYPERNKLGALSLISQTWNNLTTPARRWMYKQKRLRELREVARSSNAMCVLTPAYCRQLRELGVMDGTTCTLQAIANPCAFEPLPAPPAKRLQLVYVGRLEAVQKSPQRLIPIWRELCDRFPDWELIIVGDGPCRRFMEQDAAELPRIRFEGYQSPAPYFRDAAICCLTSTVEGFGLVLLEGMCQGAVPVAFNSFPVLGELLTGHMDKLAAKPFDTHDFATKCAYLMEHEEEREALAKACMAKSAEYTPQAIANQWEALFANMAGAQ